MSDLTLYHGALLIVLAPLIGSLLAGLFGKQLGRSGAHWVTCLGVGVACLASLYILYGMLTGRIQPVELKIYHWAEIGDLKLEVGFLIDRLTVLMMSIVTFVSLMVHIYTIGYMHDDPGYQRFFSYISLFTFAMLMLVMSNNFLQLFFGWEAVGLVSYLLIGFWYDRESAVFANLKAFLVNRVGDFGFLLGIAAVFMVFHTFNYLEVFSQLGQTGALHAGAPTMEIFSGHPWSLLTIICICLFIGAMGKSAQAPLHVWLPDSMEGPTPISALIHAATMVTAGVFMVARMSPLFELSEVARSFILVIGASTAFFMGILGLVQYDIKRVIAYSTLSQLGYMVVALGASAYAASIFHLMTHAFYKALLFLAAGSVIIGMHHEQDMRKMGNLRKYMPITYWVSLIGSLSLIGMPFFAGYYSKDMIIDAVKHAHLPGAGYAYLAVLLSVFVTALYSFRLIFMVFHGNERIEPDAKAHLHESPAVVWVPLVILAVPAIFIGGLTINSLLFAGEQNYFQHSLFVEPQHNVLSHLAAEFHGAISMGWQGFMHLPFALLVLGVMTAWLCYIKRPDLPGKISRSLNWIYQILLRKYGFDYFNQKVFAGGAVRLGRSLFNIGDRNLIDGAMVNGSAKSVGALAQIARRLQTGYLYNYALAIILGLLAGLIWLVY